MDFYAIKRKRLMNAKKIYNDKRIQLLLSNAYLNLLLKKYLNAAINNEDAEIEYSTESELIIRKKYFSDSLHLTFTQENEVKIILNANNEDTIITIVFDEDEKRIVFNKTVTVPHRTMTLSEKTIERKTYIDNVLRYKYLYCSLEDLPPFKGEDILITDIYIDLDNNAVVQKMTLSGDKDKPKDMKLEYFETSSYYALPFNDLVEFNYNKSEEMVPSTREAFYEFVNGSNNISPVL